VLDFVTYVFLTSTENCHTIYIPNDSLERALSNYVKKTENYDIKIEIQQYGKSAYRFVWSERCAKL